MNDRNPRAAILFVCLCFCEHFACDYYKHTLIKCSLSVWFLSPLLLSTSVCIVSLLSLLCDQKMNPTCIPMKDINLNNKNKHKLFLASATISYRFWKVFGCLIVDIFCVMNCCTRMCTSGVLSTLL